MSALRELLVKLKFDVDKKALVNTDALIEQTKRASAALEGGWNRLKSAARGVLFPRAVPAAVQATSGAADRATSSAVRLRGALQQIRPPSGIGVALAGVSQAARSAVASVQRFRGAITTLWQLTGATNALGSAWSSLRTRVAGLRFPSLKPIQTDFVSLKEKIFNAHNAVLALATSLGLFRAAQFVNEIVGAGSQLTDMMSRTRMSADTLQTWMHFGGLAGAQASDVEKAFRKLAMSMGMAERSSKSAQALAFKDLGVAIKDSTGKLRPLEDVLVEVGSSLSQLEDDARATAYANDLLGASGIALIPAFQGTTEEIKAQIEEIRKHAVVMSAEEAAAFDEVDDMMVSARLGFKAFAVQIVMSLLPALRKGIEWFQKATAWVSSLLKNTNGLLPILGAFAVSLGAMALKGAGAFTALSKIVGIARVGAAVFAKWLLPALLLEDFFTWLSGGDSVFGDVMVAAFGGEDAEAIRQDVLAFFEKLKQLAKDILPDVKAIFESEAVQVFGGFLRDLVLATLNLIGIALTDNHEKQERMWNAFLKNANGVEKAIDGVLAKLKKLRDWFRDNPISRAMSAASEALGFGGKEKAEAFMQKAWARDASGKPSDAGAPSKAWEDIKAWISGTPRAPAAPMPGNRNVNLTDQRTLTINVEGGADPAKTGREVGKAVDAALERDRRGTLADVGG